MSHWVRIYASGFFVALLLLAATSRAHAGIGCIAESGAILTAQSIGDPDTVNIDCDLDGVPDSNGDLTVQGVRLDQQQMRLLSYVPTWQGSQACDAAWLTTVNPGTIWFTPSPAGFTFQIAEDSGSTAGFPWQFTGDELPIQQYQGPGPGWVTIEPDNVPFGTRTTAGRLFTEDPFGGLHYSSANPSTLWRLWIPSTAPAPVKCRANASGCSCAAIWRYVNGPPL